MCQGIIIIQQRQQQHEATPRNGDSSKKLKRTKEEELALAAHAQEAVVPDSSYTADEDELSLQDLDLSLPTDNIAEPISPVRRRSSGSVGCMAVAEPHDRAAYLRDEQDDIVQAAYGQRPEFRPAKRTQAQRTAGVPRPTVGPMQSPHKYSLQRAIGEGASAKVWSAVEAETGHQAAVKAIHNSTENSCEVCAMRSVQGCANVVQIIEDFMYEGDEHIVTELAQGDLLQELQDRGPIPENQARVHTKALLSALEALHRAGYSHRDVKLENLLVSHAGVLLADFGSAAPLKTVDGEPVRHWSSVGSTSYMAPEVLAADAFEGGAADVWASGIVLYAMVAGEFPFECASPECMRFLRFTQGEHSWPMHFSPELIELITSMLLPNSDQRSIEAALSHRWFCEEACT